MRRGIPTFVLLAMLILPQPISAGGASVEAFRGIGAWVDIFDRAEWRDPEGTVRRLAAEGVDTLYLETASYRFPGPIRFPRPTGRFLDAAHAKGIRVVGWFVPGLDDLRRDLNWSLAAARFASPGGRGFDALALDIESTEVADHAERGRRLVRLSRDLRAAVGPGYPLGAVIPSWLVPSPEGGDLAAGYWRGFPYAGIAPHYDVILPMAYWTYRTGGERRTRAFIHRSVEIIRERTGRREFPIHVIGGLAEPATAADMRGFSRAVRETGVIGASMYDVATSGPPIWAALRELRPHLRQQKRPATSGSIVTLPPPPPSWRLDPAATRLDDGDRVSFRFRAAGALRFVLVSGFDVGAGEVKVLVNGDPAATLEETAAHSWGDRQRILLRGSGPDFRITFNHRDNPGAAKPWGLRVHGTAALGPV